MLSLKNIVKNYSAGDSCVEALKNVDIEFRKNEFVAVLGPSGCGKTTLLNIIGGLDRYTSGDLIIGGRSTKDFSSRDWDTYRNHSIGFVFQNYNLIPHQTVLANVELALTLSGVSKSERRKRAAEALERVGLGDQMKKKPNQMSGGQMQRVAIARALVNEPEILLADEPTGALDSATSVQIMELLKEISKDKLIIMVTHNPDLAEEYSNRIVKLLDGEVVEDSNPYHGETLELLSQKEQKKRGEKQRKSSMSFFTALSLSLNNLLTKKTRTFLTSFAGSIGIIGIALILSVSTGVQAYINRVQEDTLSSYPITIQKQNVDMSELVSTMMDINTEMGGGSHTLDKIYASPVMYDLVNKVNSIETETNNLEAFREHLEKNDEFDSCVSALKYSYNLDFNIYTRDIEGNIIKSDIMELIESIYNMPEFSEMMGAETASNPMMSSFSNINVWEELLSGENGEPVNSIIKEQYELIYGRFPEEYDEAVLIVNENNEITDMTLYALGLKTAEQMRENIMLAQKGEQIDTSSLGSWSYEEICDMEFRLVLSADKYQKQNDGKYIDISQTEAGLSYLYDNTGTAVDIKIVGIIREDADAVTNMLQGSIGYTSALTEYVIEKSAEKDVIKAQLADKDTDVFSGLPFASGSAAELTTEEKAAAFSEFSKTATAAEKATYYSFFRSKPSAEYLSSAVKSASDRMTSEEKKKMFISAISTQMGVDAESVADYVDSMSAEELEKGVNDILSAQITMQYAEEVQAELAKLTAEQGAALYDFEQFTLEQLAEFYDNFMPATVSEATYEENLKKLGYVNINAPDAINIYAKTFEDKDVISDLIEKYNEGVSEEDKISYTDYVALLMSSITTVISAISYVLIAFVAISLIVSSIMIGIITYISVLERTKEIGILRSIGASKRDISNVFNAETLIVGFVSGAIGIGITILFNAVINIILHALTGIPTLNAVLPTGSAIVLVGISMFLTFIAGLIPSGFAAKKDPVVALRSE